MPIRMRRMSVVLIVIALFTGNATAQEEEIETADELVEQNMIVTDKVNVYIGTYTDGASEGIYRAALDVNTGALSGATLVAPMTNPSFLAWHPLLKVIYAVGETDSTEERKGGLLRAYDALPSGELKVLNDVGTQGGAPCHVSVAPSGLHVAVANYSGGNAALFPVDNLGRLSEFSALVQHEGGSVDPRRQTAPHTHSVNFDLPGEILFTADLGIDQVLLYRYDLNNGTLTPNDPPFAPLAPGSGPRHLVVHPTGKFVYVVNELSNTVTAFRYHADAHRLENLQTISTLPEGYAEKNTTAEIRVHPTGDALYASNRGHDSIAIFAIDKASGKLTAKGQTPTGGRTPRNFNVDNAGNWLLAANQNSDNIVVFRIGPDGLSLTPTGDEITVGAPVCVLFPPKVE